MRATLIAPIALLLLTSASAQAGGTLYQWKDAKGVTHYTDTPPPAGQYQHRNIYRPDPDQPASTAAKPAENPSCSAARYNIALLNSQQGVRIDSDGDGKPDKSLNDEDRSNQLALAQATLKANCSAQTATAER